MISDEELYNVIRMTLMLNSNHLTLDSIESTEHYLDINEIEMAFEGLFFGMFLLNNPRFIRKKEEYIAIARQLKLDVEPNFRDDFFENLLLFFQKDIDSSVVKGIVSKTREYVKRQMDLHDCFVRKYDDLVKLSNMDILPRNGYVFDGRMKRWCFKKHGSGYEFSCEGIIVDINDYFLSFGGIFNANRLFFYLKSIGFNFNGEDADDAIDAALTYLESQGRIVKALSNGYYRFLQN